MTFAAKLHFFWLSILFFKLINYKTTFLFYSFILFWAFVLFCIFNFSLEHNDMFFQF